MGKATILNDGSVVKTDNITPISYFTTGHLARFLSESGDSYHHFTDIDNLDKGYYNYYEYQKYKAGLMTLEEFIKGNNKFTYFENARPGDEIQINIRTITENDLIFHYCWEIGTRIYLKEDYIKGKTLFSQSIPVDKFKLIKDRCDNKALNSEAYNYFISNIGWAGPDKDYQTLIGNIAQLINNIDKHIYEAFTENSLPDKLKEEQKKVWNSFAPGNKESTNLFYKSLMAYYDNVINNLEKIKRGEDLQQSVELLNSFHPKILILLDVDKKLELLNYIAKERMYDRMPSYYEELALKIINSFDLEDDINHSDIDVFLDGLLSYSYNDSNLKKNAKENEYEISRSSITIFELLYNRMSESFEVTKSFIELSNSIFQTTFKADTNKELFTNLIYILWLHSKFNPYYKDSFDSSSMSLLGEGINTTFKYTKIIATKYDKNLNYTINKTAAPAVLNYKSEKEYGVFNDNFQFEFTGNKKICALTNDWNSINDGSLSETPPLIKREWDPYGYYDIYQPVTLLDNLKEDSIPIINFNNINDNKYLVPVFYLKFIVDMKNRKDVETWIFRSIDILSMFSGAGGFINKFAHIRHLSKFDKIILFTSGIQLSSGATNFVLSFVSNCNSSFCQKLKTFLFWLELSSLGADGLIAISKKLAAKKFIIEVDKGNTPNGFKTPEGDEFIEKARNIAFDIDLTLLIKKRIDTIFDNIYGNLANRIKGSSGAFHVKHFKKEFTPENIKKTIEFCLNLDISDTKTINDFILMACRGDKLSNFPDLLIQINYYTKVILNKGFISGVKSFDDYKLLCTQVNNHIRNESFLSKFSNKILEIRFQGSVLKKRHYLDPADPLNTPYLEKTDPFNPTKKIMDTPNDADVDIVMSRVNAHVVANQINKYWQEFLTKEKNVPIANKYRRIIQNLNEDVKRGIIHGNKIPPYSPNQLRPNFLDNLSAATKKLDGTDLFVPLTDKGISEVNVSIIVKGSNFDISPNMPFIIE